MRTFLTEAIVLANLKIPLFGFDVDIKVNELVDNKVLLCKAFHSNVYLDEGPRRLSKGNPFPHAHYGTSEMLWKGALISNSICFCIRVQGITFANRGHHVARFRLCLARPFIQHKWLLSWADVAFSDRRGSLSFLHSLTPDSALSRFVYSHCLLVLSSLTSTLCGWRRSDQ